VRANPETRTLSVGPESAGAFPGPVCYGRGGTVPTVTDAELVLGYLDPDNFAGGKMKLDRAAAFKAIAGLGKQVGMSAVACAAGICRIVELNMADIIRKVTVEKGFDPRDFVLFAFGGAGPAHAGVFAAELGVKRIVVPQRKAASTWCAFGAAAADVLHIFEHSEILGTPVAAEIVNRALQSLEEDARARLAGEGIASRAAALRVLARRAPQGSDQRSRGAASVEPRAGGLRASPAQALRRALRAAVRPRLVAARRTARDRRLPAARSRAHTAAAAVEGKRYIESHSNGRASQAALDLVVGIEEDSRSMTAERLTAGNSIRGPAIVETADTTVVVHPGRTLRVDALGNFEITFRKARK
jgi:N-methylhydantoinase A